MKRQTLTSESENLKKTEKTAKRPAAAESDYVTNKVLTVFAGDILLMAFSAYLRKGLSYASSFPTAYWVARASEWAGLILAAAGIVIHGRQLARGSYNGKTLFNGVGLLMLGLPLSLCGYLMLDFGPESAMHALYLLIPAAAILYLVYAVYPREFFTLAAAMTADAVLLWLVAKSAVSNSFADKTWLFFALGLAVCAGLEGLYLGSRKEGGQIKMGKFVLRLFDRQTKHALVAGVAGGSAALLAASFLLGGGLGYYAVYAMAAALFVMAVYYTVRMM